MGLVLLVVVVFTHNPTDGYVWEEAINEFDRLPPTAECSMDRLDALATSHARKTSAEEEEENRLVAACFPSTTSSSVEMLPFSEWRSVGALQPWFASPANCLWAIFAIIVGAMGWAWVLRPEPALIEEP